MSKRLRVTALVVAVLAASGVTIAVGIRPRDAASVIARRQDVVETAVASGKVVAPARIQVGVLTGGVVAEVAVLEGQRVKAGDPLLRMDDRVELAAVGEARAAVAQARARLLEVTELVAARARAQVAAAEAELLQQQSRVERLRKLVSSGAVTGVELEDAETALTLARARRDAAQAEATASRPGGAQVLVAESELEAARAQLQSAEVRLTRTRVLAQDAGTVLRRDVEPGDAVQPGRTLLVLASARGESRGLEIVVAPDERNLAVLAVGQRATVAADAFPESPFDATVRDIAPLVDAGRGTVEVRLAVDKPPAFLCSDMTVTVEVITGRKENTVVLPQAAVRDLATTSPWVLALEGERAEKRPVRLGARGTDVVEVLDGVDVGVAVLTDPRLKPGARVRPTG